METSRKSWTYRPSSLIRSFNPTVKMTSISKPAFNFHGHFMFLHWGTPHSSTAGVKKSDPEPIKTNRSLWINSNDLWIWPWFRLKCCGALGIQETLDVTRFFYLQKSLPLGMSTSKHPVCESSACLKTKSSGNIQRNTMQGELPYSLCKVNSRYFHSDGGKERETNSVHRWRIHAHTHTFDQQLCWGSVWGNETATDK